MKSLLYIGAALMIGAGIYGFVNYKQTQHDKNFTGLYTEKKNDVKVTPVQEIKLEKEKGNPSEAKVVKTEPKKEEATKTVVKKKNRRIRSELFSRAPLRDE